MRKFILLLFCLYFSGCKGSPGIQDWETGYKELVAQEGVPAVLSDLDSTPCNIQASDTTGNLLSYIAQLSEDPYTVTLSGQSCGHTYDSVQEENLMGYQQQIVNLYNKTGKWPAIIALDYGHDHYAAPEALSAANDLLIDYWNSGGLVSVGWSPHNPWLYINANEGEQGDWSYTRTSHLTPQQLNQIDLEALWDEDNPAHAIWMEMLDRTAGALQELQEAGVVVLFKPIQEMNGNWFWWGISSHKEDPRAYVTFYRNLYTYFTVEKGLNNILWMYSPASFNPLIPFVGNYIKPQMWNYPGDEYVDIIAPTAYNNWIYVDDYNVMATYGKPLAMSELGPDSSGNNGNFDTRIIIERLSSQYPGMAFWISWHDWSNGDGTFTSMSLSRNKNAGELMSDQRVLTREELDWQE